MRRGLVTAVAAVSALAMCIPGLVIGADWLANTKPAQSTGVTKAVVGMGSAPALQQRVRPLVLAHRGASARLPENTLEAFRKAFELGADIVELDLVSTRDGVLVARHEPMLSLTTDVARRPRFADRKKTKPLYGRSVTDWFVEDFTLAELKQLRVTEREPRERPESARHDGKFQVPTLQEVIDLLRSASGQHKRQLGMALELKQRNHFARAGLKLEQLLAQALRDNKLDGPMSPVTVLSFSEESLRLTRKLVRVPLCRLVAAHEAIDLQEVRLYADAVAFDKGRLRGMIDAIGQPSEQTADEDLVRMAHKLRLEAYVHLFTRRDVGLPLPDAAYRDTDRKAEAAALAEYRAYLMLGVDGMITDNPDLARLASASR